MKIAIVGHEKAKFTRAGEAEAKDAIHSILTTVQGITHVVSGGCHLGGIDIWAEEAADHLGIPKLIFKPKRFSWSDGYKPRNIQIAVECDVLYCLAVTRLANAYKGMQFNSCYHCNSTDHIKGGGCWTMKYAARLDKPTHLIKIENLEGK